MNPFDKHTPGPWGVVFKAGAWLVRSNGRAIAQLVAHDPQDEANARLIAAAPEMLTLLNRVNCSRTLHMDGQPFVKGCPGCDARALLARIAACDVLAQRSR